MSSYFEDILKKLGWEDGFQIPVANAENQQLEEEVAKLTLQKIKAKTGLETSTVKLENLENHINYISQENEQTQNLITTHAQQLQSEEERLRITEADRDKYDCEIKTCEKKISEIKERLNLQRTHLEKYTKKLDKLKAETDWDSEALRAWEETLQKKDDDNELIKKFSKQDDRKYKELEAKMQNLEVEYASRKHTVDRMICDLNNYERMLERTGKIMKQQDVERNALIQQWKDSVKILHQRDAEIDRVQSQIFELQEILEKEEEKLEEQKQFHQNEISNNAELEHDTRQLNSLNSKLRRELNELTQNFYLMNSQADGMRRTMIHEANQLEKARKRKKLVTEKIEHMQDKILSFKQSLDDLKVRNDVMRKSMASADEKAKHLEKLIDYEQKQKLSLELECEILQNQYTRSQHELQEQIGIGKTKNLYIYGATTNINHLRKHIEDKRKDLGIRKEDAYELDYKIDEIQRNILIKENVIHTEDSEKLEAKLGELENTMAEISDIKNVLKDQVNRIRDDMRRLTTAIVADQDQLHLWKDRLQHQNLSYEGGQKQLQGLKSEIQEKRVEENILRLRVNQLNKAMKKEEKSIYTMKRFKLTLEQATKERLLEIDANKEILFVKRRNLTEDKGRLKCDIAERRIKLEQFKKKYDITLQSLGKDEDGQPISIIHFKIRNAQEKFLLQKEGDELDVKIKKAEKEILAMENTLKLVNLTNNAFKQSLGAVAEDGKEVNEMKNLEQQLLLVNDVFRECRKNLAVKRKELEEVIATCKDVENQLSQAKDKLFDLEQEYLQVQKEKSLKEEKLQRAENCLRCVIKKLRRKDRENYDRDLQIRQLKDANVSVMQRLVEMSIRYQEIAPLITRYTLEYEIKLPDKRSISCLTASSETSRSTVTCSKKKDVSDSSSESSDSRTSTTLSKVVLSFRV